MEYSVDLHAGLQVFSILFLGDKKFVLSPYRKTSVWIPCLDRYSVLPEDAVIKAETNKIRLQKLCLSRFLVIWNF